ILKKMPDTIRSINELALFKQLIDRYGATLEPAIARSMDARATVYFTHHLQRSKDLASLSQVRNELSAFPLEMQSKNMLRAQCATIAESMLKEQARGVTSINILVDIKNRSDAYFRDSELVTELEAWKNIDDSIDRAAEV